MSLLLRLIPGNPAVGPFRGIQGYTRDPLPNKSRLVTPPSPSQAQTIVVGQATETDSVPGSVTVLYTDYAGIRAISQIAAHSYPPLSNKSRLYALTSIPPITVAVGQASETDTAQAVSVVFTSAPGIRSITSIKGYSADPLPNKSRLLARYGLTVSVGQAVETDSVPGSITVVFTSNPSVSSLTQIKAHSYASLPNKSRLYSRVGIVISVGQALESDTAQAITLLSTEHPAIKPIMPATAYTAPPLPNRSRLHPEVTPIAVAVGQAIETDTASAVAVQFTDYPGSAITPIKAHSYPASPNRSRSYQVAASIIVPVGQALETDTALVVSVADRPARVTWPIPAHSYALLPNRSRRIEQNGFTIAVGQAVETDTAQPVSAVLGESQSIKPTRAIKAHSYDQLPNKSRLYTQRNQSIPVGQALETDTAQPVTVFSAVIATVLKQIRAFTSPPLANESRVYSYAQSGISVSVGQAQETDTAQPVTVLTTEHPTVKSTRQIRAHSPVQVPNKSRLYAARGTTVLVGQALETDTAQAITLVITEHAALVVRAIKAFTTAPLKNLSRLYSRQGVTIAVGQATETDTATSVKANQTCHVGQALEIDASNPVNPIFTFAAQKSVIRPIKAHNPFQVPTFSRLIEVIAPDIYHSGKTVVSAGMQTTRIKSGVGDVQVSAELQKGRISTHQGDVVIDATLRKNRIDAD
jgi:hypothetical protein